MPGRLGIILGAAALLIATFSGQAAALDERRVALVIGIANYQTVPKLTNTINDSRLIARTLEAMEFDVQLLVDAGLDEFREAVDEFAFKAETADLALVYFAGHGVEFGGKNFLIPADSTAANHQQLADTSILDDELVSAVERARRLRIVILDSCRDDPFAGGSSEIVSVNVRKRVRAGLAKPSPERGTLVAYAAEDGKTASDGGGINSPFAVALAENLRKENLEIGLVFRRVRDEVLRATDNQQVPHTYGSLSGEPYFLAGSNRQINTITGGEPGEAWSKLSVEQETQFAAMAEEGDIRATRSLAYMRLDPNEKRFDAEEAAALLEKVAEQGDPEAQYELGRLYELGIGVDQDVERAIELFREAADADYPDAINDLGFLHFQGGLGVPRDPKRAIALFERAANLRHPEAMFNYAALIDDGIVEGKSLEDAARYLYDSLRSGNEETLNQLAENPRMFKAQTRSALQRRLKERSLYEGAIDGQFGPQTMRGLRKAYGIEE